MSEKIITEENFEKEVMQSEMPFLLDFYATWCGPCKMLSPVISELAAEQEGKALVGKINVDEYPSIASKFGVVSVPTVMVFKDGNSVATSVGFRNKKELTSLLQSVMS